MSSSFRRHFPQAGLALFAASVLFSWISPAAAADYYFQPSVSAGAEYDSNRSLTPVDGNAQSLEGYFGSAEALVGIRSPRSFTEIRPRIRYQTFPSQKQFDQTEGTLDFKSNFKTLRSELKLIGRYSQQDLFNDEFANIGFDPFDPSAPPVTETGKIVVSERRTRAEFRPSYIYRWNETTGVGVDMQYQNVRYSADVPIDKQDYENYQANLNLVRQLSPQTDIAAGGYVGRFKTKDGLNKSDSVGASVGLSHDWTKQHHSELSLVVERSKAENLDAVPVEETSTDWGVQFSTFRRGEISRFRLVVGRDLTPSGSGGRAMRDEVRAQYDRDLSQRLVMTAALRAFRQRALSERNANSSSNRDAATAEVSLTWSMTPTWLVTGGYAYTWQDIVSAIGSANNHRVFASITYRALDPKRRK